MKHLYMQQVMVSLHSESKSGDTRSRNLYRKLVPETFYGNRTHRYAAATVWNVLPATDEKKKKKKFYFAEQIKITKHNQ